MILLCVFCFVNLLVLVLLVFVCVDSLIWVFARVLIKFYWYCYICVIAFVVLGFRDLD